jgi:hypothetical protein
MADVEIMMEQIKQIYGIHAEVEIELTERVRRLDHRIEKKQKQMEKEFEK